MESEEDHGQHGQPRPRPASELPGLITQDTTMITPGSGPVKFPESGLAENEVRTFFRLFERAPPPFCPQLSININLIDALIHAFKTCFCLL